VVSDCTSDRIGCAFLLSLAHPLPAPSRAEIRWLNAGQDALIEWWYIGSGGGVGMVNAMVSNACRLTPGQMLSSAGARSLGWCADPIFEDTAACHWTVRCGSWRSSWALLSEHRTAVLPAQPELRSWSELWSRNASRPRIVVIVKKCQSTSDRGDFCLSITICDSPKTGTRFIKISSSGSPRSAQMVHMDLWLGSGKLSWLIGAKKKQI
jgi:hypothetical protein